MPIRFAGRIVSVVLMSLAFAVVGGITLAMVAEKLVPPEGRAEALCYAGFPEIAGEKCVNAEIVELRKRVREERARLVRERQELEAMILDTEAVLFQAASPTGTGYIVVAASYSDPKARKGLIGAACFYAGDTSGPDPRLPLGRMASGGAITPSTFDTARMGEFGLDASSFAAAQTACPWPSAS